MAQPRPYERDYDFTSFQVRHATTPPPGDKLDAEFDQIAATIDEVLLRIKDLQRDDLQLANFIVGYDQLKPELRNGFTTPTVWVTGKKYAIGASIYVGPKVYAALVAHTSGVFAADLSAGKWHLLADFTIVAGAVQTAVDAAAAAVVSATEAAASAFTASTAALNAQALLDTIDVNDVTTVAGIAADITAAVANATDISTVAGVASSIPAVAGIAADVETVAGIAADVTAAAANMAAIIAAPDAAEAAAESAQAAADIAATLAGVVVGPASAAEDRIAVFSGTTGKLIKDGGKTLAEVVPANNSITNAILADMATATIKGRAKAATGDPEDLTAAQVLTLLKAVGAYAKDNIRGTVAQTGGVPTGAIIERGSNANGEYVRYADGTQICWNNSVAIQDVTTATGSVFRTTTATTWTFPMAFVSTPVVTVNPPGVGRWGSFGGLGLTSVDVYQIGASSSASTTATGAKAIGRWF